MRIALDLNATDWTLYALVHNTLRERLLSLGQETVFTDSLPLFIRDMAAEFIEVNFGKPTGTSGSFPDAKSRDLQYQAQKAMTVLVNQQRAKRALSQLPVPQKFEHGESVSWLRGDSLRVGEYLAAEGYGAETAVVNYAGTPVHIPVTELRLHT